MTVENAKIIKKLQELKQIYAIYSRVTRMPYAICDPESFNDQVMVFTDEERVKEFAKEYTENNILLMGVKVMKNQYPIFYMNLFSMGINSVLFFDGDDKTELELDQIVKIPDFSKLPENQRPLMNPQLQLTVLYFLQELRKPEKEPNRELLNELEEEMSVNLVRSRYIMEIELLEPEKEITQETENKNIRIPYIKDKDGNIFQSIFTDHNELVKFHQNKENKPNRRTILVPFTQLNKYLVKESKGFVLNPAGFNLVLTKEQMEMLNQRFGTADRQTEKN